MNFSHILSPYRNVYLYGSRAYGIHNETSDFDFICVGNENTEIKTNEYDI